MTHQELTISCQSLNGNLANICLVSDPQTDFLADIEFDQDGNVLCEEGEILVFWTDRVTLTQWAETMDSVAIDDIVSLVDSGLPSQSVNLSHDDPSTAIENPKIFPQ